MFNPDKPITSIDDDALGRKGVAKELGDALLADSNKESHVIGIYGKWGYGKTSFINMVLEHVENESTNFDKNKSPIIINFNPWNFSNQNQLISQFFNQLSNDFCREDNSEWLKNSGKMFKTYSKAILPLSIVPQFLPFVISTSVASGLVGKLAEIVGHHNKSIEEIKNEICENQIKYDGRIIIVIDDIDRLNEIEIKQIFQLVKSIADFPNTTYVLTFDREVVSKALETEQCGNGNQYLEKIVQIPFELPEISRSELISLLDTQISKIIVRNPHDDFYEKAYIEMLNRGVYHFFNNIRDINRYINVANFNYEVLKEEVNVIDFIGITAIQVFLPELYQEIKSNRHVFLSTEVSSNSQNDNDKAICVEILNRYDIKRRNILQNFLTMLFPKLSSFYGNTTHSSEAYVLWRKNRRICSEYFFNVYFRFAVSETKISQAEMKILLSKGNDVVTILESIQNIIKDGKGSDFLISLLDKTDIIPVEDIESFVTAIFVVGDSLEETSTNSFYIQEIIYSLLKKIESRKERYNILKKSTNYANNSLYIVAKEIASLENDENEFISYEDLDELKQLICNRFSACLKEGKLIHSPHFYPILQFMGKWRAKDELENYTKLIALDDDALLLLITNVMEHHAIQPIDFTQKNWANWVQLVISLNQLIEVSYIKERLIEIKESVNYVDLNENMKVALEAFLNGIELAEGN